jgi:sugar diacid utilization regulator
LHSLFVLSMMMFTDRNEEDILTLAMTSVAALGPCVAEAGYLVRDESLVPVASGDRPSRALDDAVRVLGGEDGAITAAGGAWSWAFALRRTGAQGGYLVVGGASEPSRDEFFLLKALAQQTAAAMSNASLHQKELEQAQELRRLYEERAVVNAQLQQTVSDLEQRRQVHEVLTRGIATDGEQGIADALSELTGHPVAVEDRFGNLRAWAGPGCPDPYPKPQAERRDEVLSRLVRQGGWVREKNRVLVVVQPRDEILGVLSIIDPDNTAGAHEMFVLEHGAILLALEFTHQHKLAEVELRLRRELVDDLITGTDDASAYARSEAVGHDLHGAHYVVVLRWRGIGDDRVVRAVEHTAVGLQLKILVARRPNMVVVLVSGRPDTGALHRAIGKELGTTTGSIGVGGRCESPADFPRSCFEAVRALDIRLMSRNPDGASSYDELGVFRILHTGEDGSEIEQFVRDWLGALIDYDVRRNADLVPTLSHYLECGGNYDEAAAASLIHRSTLRYRLQRIREITGFDLADVDQRLNLHLATRALKVLEGGP